MNFRTEIKGKSFFLFAALTVVMLNSGCGGSSSQLASQPQPISVVLSTASASVVPGGTTTVSATVSNDSTNTGVSWSCAPANACGLFSPSSTASAVATTYTAPAVVPAGGQVTVTAISITDPTKSASSVVMINDPASEVRFDVSPPLTIHPSQTASVSASVSDDTAGVTWSCSPAGTCGTFSLAATAQRGRDQLCGAIFRGFWHFDHHYCYLCYRHQQMRQCEYVVLWNRFRRDPQRPIRFLPDIPDREPWYGVTSREHKIERGRNGCRRCR